MRDRLRSLQPPGVRPRPDCSAPASGLSVSIAWPRSTDGNCGNQPPDLDFYNRWSWTVGAGHRALPDSVHWDLPAALQRDDNGWANRRTAFDSPITRASSRSISVIGCIRLRPTTSLGHRHTRPRVWIFAPGLEKRAMAPRCHIIVAEPWVGRPAIRSARSNIDVAWS